MVRRQRFFIAFCVLLCFASASCQYLGGAKLETPKQKAAFYMGLYNDQYQDYKQKIALPDLTEDEKEILAVKKQVLSEVYPLITAYDLAIVEGGQDQEATEAEIKALFNRLETLIIRAAN